MGKRDKTTIIVRIPKAVEEHQIERMNNQSGRRNPTVPNMPRVNKEMVVGTMLLKNYGRKIRFDVVDAVGNEV